MACKRERGDGVQGREPVCRAANRRWPTVQNVSIDHRRAHILVTQQFLNGADVVTVFEQVGCKRVPECVRCCRLDDTRLADRLFDSSLDHRFVEMVPPSLAGLPVDITTGRRKDPLPRPFSPRVGILALERARKRHPPRTVAEVPLVLLPYRLQVSREAGRMRVLGGSLQWPTACWDWLALSVC